MGLNFTRPLKFIFLVILAFVCLNGVAQICSINKFNTYPDSLNQKRKDTSICSTSCLDLYGSVPVLKQTTSYSIFSIPFRDTIPCEGSGTIPSGFTAPDNIHSPIIGMGFNFCFFGNSYNRCVISDNGYISFDTTLAGNTSKYDLTSYPGLPSQTVIDYMNSIMGCGMDLFVPLNGSITYQTIGAAPYRVFLVKYNRCAFGGASCPFPAQELDMKIALYETTNFIEVYIKKKTTCVSWNGGKAIQGIQDENGMVAYVTTGRNNTQWSVNNDARRFVPNGSPIAYNLDWYSNNVFQGNGTQITVCPKNNGWYRADLTISPYCGISQPIIVSDSVYVNIKGTSTIANSANVFDTVRCATYFKMLDAGAGGIAYRWNTGGKSRYLPVSKTGVYICSKITDTVNCYFDSLRYEINSEKVFLDSSSNFGCFSQGLGNLKVHGSGGKGAIQYKIANENYSAFNSFDSLTYGSYHVKIKDSLGCEFDTLITFARPNINIIQRNTCGADSIGTIVMSINNFDGPYTFKMDTGSYKTDTFFVNVKGGTHTFSIKNANGCVYDSTINAPFTSLKLNASYSVVKASGCTGGTPDGSITVNTSGGNPPYRYSINYGSYKSSNVFSGLNEGSYYISIRDTFGCGIDSAVQVGALAHLYVNGYVINASCFNTNTATIVVNGFGGVPPYSFSFGGGPYTGVNVKTGLGAGTMTVSIKDGRGCVLDSVLPIGQPPPLQFAPTITHVSCFRGNDGQIKINGIGGVPPYTYSINGGSFTANSVFTPLIAGNYALKIKDYNLCTKDTNIIISQPFQLNFLVNKTNTSCWNSSDGKFILTGFGGTAPYEFSFNGGTFTTKNTYDTLAKGNYTIRIKDSKNCTRDSVIVIGSPLKINPTIVLKNVSCFGSTNGTIKVVSSGGTPPNSFSFNNSAYTNIDSFTNVSAGSYTISIKDSKGCSFDTFTIVTQPPPLWFNVSLKHITCFNDSNGEITLSAFGGTLPYQYAIGSDTFSSNNIFKKKIIGSYLLRIKDANGCLYDTTVTLTQPTILKANISLTNVTCFNGINGEISTNGIGGIPPYRYKINSGSFTSSTIHSNLPAGVYNITVSDSNGCTFDTAVFISQPSHINSLLFISNNSCFKGSDGSFKIRSAGGTPPYKYALDTTLFSSDSVFLNLKAGVYKVYTKDANNCIVDTSLIIQEPTKIITSALVKNITCYNGNDGSITLIPGGGTPPYQCSTDSIVFNNVFSFTNLVAGIYKFYLRDSKLCTYDTTVTVYQSTFITNGLIVKNVSCFNSNDGYFRVVATGGSKPYLYSFNGGAFDTISVFSNLPIGTYNIQTKDTFNCIKDTTVTLTQPPQIFVKATSINVQCYNANDGVIDVSATGGVPPFTYAVGNNIFTAATSFKGLAPNTYKVYAKDNLGCIRDTTITITQPDSFTFSSKVSDVTCYSGLDGNFSFSVTGATPPYLYSFENGIYTTDTFYTNLRSAVYTIRVKDKNNCILVRKIFVNQPPKPTLLPAEIVRATWNDDSTVLLQWRKYPQALHYFIESKYILSNFILDTFYYQKLPQTEIYNYRISVIDSCNFRNQISLMHNTLYLTGKLDEAKFIDLQWNSYKNWVNGVQHYNIYKLNTGTNLFEIAATTIDTTIRFNINPDDSSATYGFYVEAIELDGNSAISTSNKIYLYTPPQVWFPSAFSPNNDGLNDNLFPKGSGIKSYTFNIYNRWGELLFQTDETNKVWNGKYNGKEMPMDTYIYEVKAICYFNRTIEKEIVLKGSVQLVR